MEQEFIHSSHIWLYLSHFQFSFILLSFPTVLNFILSRYAL